MKARRIRNRSIGLARFLRNALVVSMVFVCIGTARSESLDAAIKEVVQKAEQGDVNAQARLGALYYEGKRVPQDYKQAVYWLTKAAEQGDVDAQVNLGVMYYAGKGGIKDDERAIHWLTKAAEQGDVQAQDLLKFFRFKRSPGSTELQKSMKPEPQLPSSILYDGADHLLFEWPLEDYFLAGNKRPDELRRYFGFFEVRDSKLYLKKISRLQIKLGSDLAAESAEWQDVPLSILFEDSKGGVFAEWYSGRLTLAQGELLERGATGNRHTYEREVQIDVENGRVKKTVVVDNAEKRSSAVSIQSSEP